MAGATRGVRVAQRLAASPECAWGGAALTDSGESPELRGAGVPTEIGVVAVLVYRVGTSFFAVALGVVAFWLSRQRLARIMRPHAPHNHPGEFAHFDQIAHECRQFFDLGDDIFAQPGHLLVG